MTDLNKLKLIIHHIAKIQGKDAIFSIEYVLRCQLENKYPYWLFESTQPQAVMKGRTYELNEIECRFVRWTAPQRTRAARAAGKVNMIQCAKSGSEKEKEKEIDGLEAELLYGKIFNLFPSEQIVVCPRNSCDDAGDYVHFSKRVDVKQTRYATGRMTLASWKHSLNIDLLSLFTGQDGRYTFRGFCTRGNLCREQNFQRLPGRESFQYILPQASLVELEEILCK
jgi:hypothetical protein